MRDSLGQAEVSESGIFVLIQKDILRFNVSVNNVALVQIVDSFKYLSENFPLERLVGFERVRLHEVLQGFTVTELHLNVEDIDAASCKFLLLPVFTVSGTAPPSW